MSALISPSLLSADFARLGDEISRVEQAGADLLHLDVMDGHFVPNITFGPGLVKAVRRVTKLPLDVHLMIDRPDDFIESFARAGADWLSVHVEICEHLHRTIQLIKSFRVRAGVAINPATPLAALEEILAEIDHVLVMSVNPGFGGQEFIRATVAKIVRLKSMIEFRSLRIPIIVDGGVALENAPDLLAVGADVLVAGNAIFGTADAAAAVRAFKELAAKVTRRSA